MQSWNGARMAPRAAGPQPWKVLAKSEETDDQMEQSVDEELPDEEPEEEEPEEEEPEEEEPEKEEPEEEEPEEEEPEEEEPEKEVPDDKELPDGDDDEPREPPATTVATKLNSTAF
jgi:hypothetical protein